MKSLNDDKFQLNNVPRFLRRITLLRLLPFSLLILSMLSLSHYAQSSVTGRILRCESIDNDHNYCLAYIRGGVKLVRQLSLEDCHYQDSWGYDKGGVWVDQGCRAEFFIRETQSLEDVVEEPDNGTVELMNMTIVAETLNKETMPDWSYSLNENIKIGVNYNDLPLPYSSEDWQSFWFLPAILTINF